MSLLINMLLKNLIDNIPKKKKEIKITGLSSNSKEVRKGNIFLLLKEIIVMGKILLKKQFIKVHQ